MSQGFAEEPHDRFSEAPQNLAVTNGHKSTPEIAVREKTALDISQDDWSNTTQEMIEALPQLWTRGLLYVLILLVGVVVPWAMLSRVDETGVARGRLEPRGKTYRIDAPVGGKVTAISAQAGGRVKVGQPLLELDTELTKSDLHQAQAKLEGQLNRLAQLQQSKTQVEISSRAQILQTQAQIAEQQVQVDQTNRQLKATQQAALSAENRWIKEQQEVERYTPLVERRVISAIQLRGAERTAEESERQLEQSQASVQQAETELIKQQKATDRVMRTGQLNWLASQKQAKDVQGQITDAKAEIAQTQQAIGSLKLQLQQRTIKSPVHGNVFELSVARPGAVLSPGQMVAQIAALGTPLILRAQMPSSESGFLRVGMPVKLKFDAYPFQEHGVIPAKLSKISPDSKAVQTAQNGQTTQNQTPESNSPSNIDMFELEITLQQTCIRTSERCIPLSPGQTATAEVVTQQRRLIDFFLDPFKKLQRGDFKL